MFRTTIAKHLSRVQNDFSPKNYDDSEVVSENKKIIMKMETIKHPKHGLSESDETPKYVDFVKHMELDIKFNQIKDGVDNILKVKVKNNEDVYYSCQQCDYKTKKKNYLTTHLRSIHGNLTYYCDQCSYSTRWKNSVKRHIESQHENIFYKCDECPRKLRRSCLKKHIETVHENITYACEMCNYKIGRKWELKQHIESVHENITYPCEKCGYNAKSKKDLKNHFISEHGNINNSYNQVELASSDTSLLSMKQKNFACIQCDKRFVQNSTLRQHTRSVHDGIKYSCDKCDKEFTSTSGLLNHKKLGHDGVRFPCSQCDYLAYDTRHLQKHNNTKHLNLTE